jgi:hypothetical protein
MCRCFLFTCGMSGASSACAVQRHRKSIGLRYSANFGDSPHTPRLRWCFQVVRLGDSCRDRYPLVNVYITMEHHHFQWKIHEHSTINHHFQ